MYRLFRCHTCKQDRVIEENEKDYCSKWWCGGCKRWQSLMMWVDLTDQPWAAETIARLRDVEPMARLSGIVGVTADGCIMGIDRESGGYPWKAYKPNGSIQSVGNIHFFKDDEDADRYLEMFPEYKKKKITITITEES